MPNRAQAKPTKSPKMVAPAILAAITRKARRTTEKVRYSHDWAVTMTKWLITRTNSGVKWQIVEFLGPRGGESTGIVDLIAIRKDHSQTSGVIRRGDYFEIILLQVKGGNADWPIDSEIKRLRQVAKHHRAKSVVLAEWKKGTQPSVHLLTGRTKPHAEPKQAWAEVSATEVFG